MRLRSVVLVFLLSACRDQRDVRLGIVLSRDGVDAAALAVDDINRSGILGARKLSTRVIPDSSGSAVPAITTAETLAADASVIGVVGHSNSASTLAASTIYNEKHLSHIAPTSTVALLNEAGPFSFRMVGSDDNQADFLSEAVERHPNARIAIMFVNDDYGRGIHERLEGLLRKSGRTIVYEAPYAEAARFGDSDANAGAIARNRPDILFWLGRPVELARILPVLRRADASLLVVASDGVQDRITGDSASMFAGMQYAHIGPVLSDLKEVVELDRRFRGRFHYALTTQGLKSYEAVMLYGEALRTVGADRTKIRDYLASLGRARPAYDGVSGKIQFDSTGAARSGYMLMQVGPDGKPHPTHLRTP